MTGTDVVYVWAEPAAVAGWLMTKVVPSPLMLTILVPLGIPVPLMNMPTERPAVLETVTLV